MPPEPRGAKSHSPESRGRRQLRTNGIRLNALSFWLPVVCHLMTSLSPLMGTGRRPAICLIHSCIHRGQPGAWKSQLLVHTLFREGHGGCGGRNQQKDASTFTAIEFRESSQLGHKGSTRESNICLNAYRKLRVGIPAPPLPLLCGTGKPRALNLYNVNGNTRGQLCVNWCRIPQASSRAPRCSENTTFIFRTHLPSLHFRSGQ